MYEAFPIKKKAEWFRYIADVYQNCMIPDGKNAVVRPLTTDCLDKFHTDFKMMDVGKDVDWTRYFEC